MGFSSEQNDIRTADIALDFLKVKLPQGNSSTLGSENIKLMLVRSYCALLWCFSGGWEQTLQEGSLVLVKLKKKWVCAFADDFTFLEVCHKNGVDQLNRERSSTMLAGVWSPLLCKCKQSLIDPWPPLRRRLPRGLLSCSGCRGDACRRMLSGQYDAWV